MSELGFNIRWSPLPETEHGEIVLGTAKALRAFLEGVDDTTLVFLGSVHGNDEIPVTPEHYPESVNIIVASSHPKNWKMVKSWN